MSIIGVLGFYLFPSYVCAALRLLKHTGGTAGQPLSISSLVVRDAGTVFDALLLKHPDLHPVSLEHLLLSSTPPRDHDPHSVVFDRTDGTYICHTVLKLDGDGGPSGLDASSWKCLCTSFSSHSYNLCAAVAGLSCKLCTSYIDSAGLSSFVACRLITLDKNPGVQPIGIVKSVGSYGQTYSRCN